MSTILVIGSGMVGSAIAMDLANKHRVTVADINLNALTRLKQKNDKIETKQLNITEATAVKETVKPFDLVVCAVPGFLGFQNLRNVLEAGKNVVDISFFPEDALKLHELAKSRGVTAIVDCGVAPGMGNIILGYYNEKMVVTDFECLVGGLPKVKKWPFAYKAPFSPIDVIEEYTRPARFRENGQLITREALSDVELVEFEGIGTLESFNSDGLRSLLFTLPHIKNMKEKTLRYPGHVEYIKVLRSSGFFETTPIEFRGYKIIPLEFTSRILFDEWKLKDTEEEFTVMRITIKGKAENGKEQTIVYDLFDAYHKESGISSMARTTGYTATAAANLFLEGLFTEPGVFPPELIGKHPGCFEYIINYLKLRGVNYAKTLR